MPTYLWALLASALPAFVAGYSLGAARHVSSRTGAPSAVGVASNAFRMLRTRGGQMQTAVSVKDAGLCKKLEVPSELLDSVDIFIFDCDGVIWKGDSLIDGVPAVLEMLRKAGKKIFFVTNNSTKSRKGYKGKFTSLGLEVEPEEIFSSSFAAAAYLEQTKFKETGKKVYIVGEVGIQEELDLIGVPHIGAPRRLLRPSTIPPPAPLRAAAHRKASVCARACRWAGGRRQEDRAQVGLRAAARRGRRRRHRRLRPEHQLLQDPVRAALHQREPGLPVHRDESGRGDAPAAGPTRGRTAVPSASLGRLKAQGSPAHPGAPPQWLGRSPWREQLASGRLDHEGFRLQAPDRRAGVGGQRRDGGRDQGVHRAGAGAGGQAERADDRLHCREVRLRAREDLQGSWPKHGCRRRTAPP